MEQVVIHDEPTEIVLLLTSLLSMSKKEDSQLTQWMPSLLHYEQSAISHTLHTDGDNEFNW